jgi:chromosome segregation ATPase
MKTMRETCDDRVRELESELKQIESNHIREITDQRSAFQKEISIAYRAANLSELEHEKTDKICKQLYSESCILQEKVQTLTLEYERAVSQLKIYDEKDKASNSSNDSEDIIKYFLDNMKNCNTLNIDLNVTEISVDVINRLFVSINSLSIENNSLEESNGILQAQVTQLLEVLEVQENVISEAKNQQLEWQKHKELLTQMLNTSTDNVNNTMNRMNELQTVLNNCQIELKHKNNEVKKLKKIVNELAAEAERTKNDITTGFKNNNFVVDSIDNKYQIEQSLESTNLERKIIFEDVQKDTEIKSRYSNSISTNKENSNTTLADVDRLCALITSSILPESDLSNIKLTQEIKTGIVCII